MDEAARYWYVGSNEPERRSEWSTMRDLKITCNRQRNSAEMGATTTESTHGGVWIPETQREGFDGVLEASVLREGSLHDGVDILCFRRRTLRLRRQFDRLVHRHALQRFQSDSS